MIRCIASSENMRPQINLLQMVKSTMFVYEVAKGR